MTSCTEPFPDPFSYYPANLQVGDFSIEEVGIRKKGFVGSVLSKSEERPSLKIKSDKYVDGQLIDDYVKVTLNNNLTDPTRIRTCLTYHIFNQSGYSAPRCNLANVMMNGVSLGLYSHVEDVKEEFLEREFNNSNGSLYEITIVDFSLEHLEEGLGRWEPKTDSTKMDNSLLLNIAQALLVENDDLEQELGELLEIDSFIRFWALETITAHTDGYTTNSNNSFVYFDPDREDKAVFIPWGPDDALQATDLSENTEEGLLEDGDIYYVNSAISRRISQHPELMSQYLLELETILENEWNEDEILDLIDLYVAQVATVEPYDENYMEEISTLKNWIESRRETIQGFIVSGGIEGTPGPLECFGSDEAGGFNEMGEATTTVSHSCSSTHNPLGNLVLLLAMLLVPYRRTGKKYHRSNYLGA